MVSVIDNRSLIIANLIAIQPDPAFAHYKLLKVRLEEIRNIEGFPQLVNETSGESIDVKIDEQVLQKLQLTTNGQYKMIIRAAGPGIYFFNDLSTSP